MGAYDKNWQDEVLGIPSGFADNTPRFDIVNGAGGTVAENAVITLANPVIQEGTDITGADLRKYIQDISKKSTFQLFITGQLRAGIC